MSLDVSLVITGFRREPTERIFIREHGETREIGRDEWEELHPGVEPVSYMDDGSGGNVYEANITHNLGRMAREAGLYEALWRPEEIGVTHARDLIPLLRTGMACLGEERERLLEFNPENGWGDYGGFVVFVAEYLVACEQYPDAEVRVSR